MIRETAANSRSGWFMLMLLPVLLILDAYWLVQSIRASAGLWVLASAIGLAVVSVMLGGFFVVEPNQSSVLMLFGTYKGSERRPGLWWTNPFMTKKNVT